MTSEVWFRRPTEADIEFVSRTMRGDDRVEAAMSNADSPRDALTTGVNLSTWSAAAMVGDSPVAILGVVSFGGLITGTKRGAPWLLGSTRLHKHRNVLLAEFPRVIYAMLQRFPVLENYAYEGSSANLRWLKHVGFRVYPAQIVPGYLGRFHRFTMGE